MTTARRLTVRLVATFLVCETLVIVVVALPNPWGYYWACFAGGLVGARGIEQLR